DASESVVRNQTERIRLRIELGQTQPELVAAVVIERLLRERIDGLLGAVDAERQFVDLRRAECVNQRRDQSRTVDLVADRQLRPAIRTAKAGEQAESALGSLVILNQAHIKNCILGRDEVQTQHGVAPRLVVDALSDPVIRASWPKGIWQWQQVE